MRRWPRQRLKHPVGAISSCGSDTLTRVSASIAKPSPVPPSTGTKEGKPQPVTKRDHLDTAADLMSDIQVETYSSMDKREKTELRVSAPLASHNG